jgi:hypothetical protein
MALRRRGRNVTALRPVLLAPGQLCHAREEAGFAQSGEVVAVLARLPGERVRVAYGAVTDLICASHMLTPISPGARGTDPGTSHQAAAGQTVPKLYAAHRQVLAALVEAGDRGLNDFELAARTGRKQTSFGVRRGELVKAGLVCASSTVRPSDTASDSKVWVVTDLGVEVWRQLGLGDTGTKGAA